MRIARFASFAGIVSVASLAVGEIGCAPRSRMCTASNECASESACVAGRCVVDKPNVKPSIDGASRLVVYPVDAAYLRRGAEAGALPAVVTLGKNSAALLLRFSVALPADANLVEAYVVLHRAGVVDDDPEPIALHATRIVDSWQGRSTSWAFAPRWADTRAPATRVDPGGPAIVRLDVRDLVREWPRHDARDQGLAIVADDESRNGMAFALMGAGGPVGSVTGAGNAGNTASAASSLGTLGATSGAGLEPGPSRMSGSGSSGAFGSDARASSAGLSSSFDAAPYLELYIREARDAGDVRSAPNARDSGNASSTR